MIHQNVIEFSASKNDFSTGVAKSGAVREKQY